MEPSNVISRGHSVLIFIYGSQQRNAEYRSRIQSTIQQLIGPFGAQNFKFIIAANWHHALLEEYMNEQGWKYTFRHARPRGLCRAICSKKRDFEITDLLICTDNEYIMNDFTEAARRMDINTIVVKAN